MNQKHTSGSAIVPLCVDLDGTLVRTDLLVESTLSLLKRNLLYLFLLPIWLVGGKANLKHQIALRIGVDPTSLPYNQEFLAFLRDEARRGRRLILATASNIRWARQVARHLGIFEEVLASDAENNLSGERKLAALLTRFGEQGFDYAANDRSDLTLWPHARCAILVNEVPGVRAAAGKVANVAQTFSDRAFRPAAYVEAMRPAQWLKNLLVFLPPFAAHQFKNPTLLLQGVLACVAFSICASSVYLLNDLLDLPADRRHWRKKHRPFAAGDASVIYGALLVPLLLIAALVVSLALPFRFLLVLSCYYVATLTYSLWLKRVVIVDVLLLAALYTARVIAGAAAAGVALSFWLLAFSMFIFLSLALVKRYTEILTISREGKAQADGRGYRAEDMDSLMSLGTSSGYAAVVVLALYINSADVHLLYKRPEAVWLLCPLLLYWISRLWLGARRGKLHDDPLVFALRDRASRYVLFLGVAVVVFASY